MVMGKRRMKAFPDKGSRVCVYLSPEAERLLRQVSVQMDVSMSAVMEHCLLDTLRSSSDVGARQMVLAYRRAMKLWEQGDCKGMVGYEV